MIKSTLMVAGDKIKHLKKIPQLKCDIAIINLEDGVYDKNMARKLVCDNLTNINTVDKKIVVRVNNLNECGKEDIKAINKIKPYAIRVPKIKTIKDIELACELIDDNIEVHLSIETKEAFENLSKLKINSRVTTVYLGILDLLESLNLPQSLVKLDNSTIDYILSRFLIDAKIAGFTPISFIYQDYKNLEEFKKWCKKEKLLGLTAKGCISLDQVDIANEIFKINRMELEKAQYIVKQFEFNLQKESTGFSDEKYGFIDEPIYKDAKQVILNNK
jgi:citrate lyase subunit beta / citryl-CoA lyase